MHIFVGHPRVFYVATNKRSGTKYPTLNLFFPEFCEVYLNLKKMASSPIEFVVDMGNEMFSKWDKCWSSENFLLALTCALDLRCKMTVVEYYYGLMNFDDTLRFMMTLKQCFNAMFKEYYDVHSKATQSESGNDTSRSSSRYYIFQINYVTSVDE